MASLIAFLLTPLGRIVGAAAGVFFIIIGFASHQRNVGATKAVAKIEERTQNAISKANSAAAKSAAGGGVRNPYGRD
jgi:hypothetical protein